MIRGFVGFVRLLLLAICALTVSWTAQARDLFSDYAKGDFDAVRKELTATTYAQLDRGGKDAFLNIVLEVYSERPDFPLSELAALYEAMSGITASSYKVKQLKGLRTALRDPEISTFFSDGWGLVLLNSQAAELGQLKGFVVPHDIYGRMAIVSLYARRQFKEEENEHDLLIKGYADSLRGRGNDTLEGYLEICKTCVYAQQVKGIVARDQLGRVGTGGYLVNAEPYKYDLEAGGFDAEHSTKHLPVRFIDPVRPTEDLRRFIASLKAAAEARDTATILAAVADDFEFERDFGGMISPGMSPAVRFQQAFTLDNSTLAEEYKDWGWNSLLEVLEALRYRGSGGRVCGPAEPEAPEDMPVDYYFSGGYINGAGVRVRAGPNLDSGIVQTLSYEALLKVATVADKDGMNWAKLRLRNGEVGYVAAKYFGQFLMPQLCFRKDGADWRISAYIGGGD